MQIHLERSLIDKNIKFIAHDLGLKINHQIPSEPYLKYDEKGLSFIKDPNNPREYIHIDYLKGRAGWRLNRSNHESNLKKALGKNQKKLHIFDATGGLLLDTMIFLSLGHKVTAIEQSKILFYLVKDALNRAESKLSFIKNLDFRYGNSIDLYKTIVRPIDIIYLDPMYPILKKNQKKSLEIETIRFLLKEEKIEGNEQDMIKKFLEYDHKKIILKRPLKSEIYSNINYQVKGKTTRFDIYL